MDHDIHLTGTAFRLRPVTLDDADAILALRGTPVHSRFMHRLSSHLADQEAWIRSYLDRPGDYYFCIEAVASGSFEGTISIYDIADGQGELGRWIIRPGSMAAVESALLIYRIAFELLSLSRVYCRTVAENKSVVSFHETTGLLRSKEMKDHFIIDGTPFDAIEQYLDADAWPPVRNHLLDQADKIARLLNRRSMGSKNDHD